MAGSKWQAALAANMATSGFGRVLRKTTPQRWLPQGRGKRVNEANPCSRRAFSFVSGIGSRWYSQDYDMADKVLTLTAQQPT